MGGRVGASERGHRVVSAEVCEIAAQAVELVGRPGRRLERERKLSPGPSSRSHGNDESDGEKYEQGRKDDKCHFLLPI
jgi:hypothetical protein